MINSAGLEGKQLWRAKCSLAGTQPHMPLFAKASLACSVPHMPLFARSLTHSLTPTRRYPVRMAVVDLDAAPTWWNSAANDSLTAAEARQMAGTKGALPSLVQILHNLARLLQGFREMCGLVPCTSCPLLTSPMLRCCAVRCAVQAAYGC